MDGLEYLFSHHLCQKPVRWLQLGSLIEIKTSRCDLPVNHNWPLGSVWLQEDPLVQAQHCPVLSWQVFGISLRCCLRTSKSQSAFHSLRTETPEVGDRMLSLAWPSLCTSLRTHHPDLQPLCYVSLLGQPHVDRKLALFYGPVSSVLVIWVCHRLDNAVHCLGFNTEDNQATNHRS